MRPLPQQHQNVLKVLGLLALGAIAGFFFLIRPLREEVLIAREETAEKQAKLQKSGWFIDSERLESLRKQRQREVEKIDQIAQDVINRATNMFTKRITAFYGPNEDFRDAVTRLDFQMEYDKFEQKMRAHRIVLAEEKLGMGPNTESPYVYQLLLHLWTLDAIMDMALANKLAVVPDRSVRVPREGAGAAFASDITALPVRAYFLNSSDKEPFVLEFPVRITFRGSVENFCNFVRALHGLNPDTKQQRFFPIVHMELHKTPPSPRTPANDAVVVTVECSAFYRTGARVSGPTPNQIRVPPGA